MCVDGGWTFDTLNCSCPGQTTACTFAPITADAGSTDASVDAGAEPEEPITGCSCGITPAATPPPWTILPLLALALRRKTSRGEHEGGALV